MDKELLIAPGQPSKKAKRVLIIVAVVAVAIWVAATVLLAISLKTTRNMVIVETDKAPAKLGPYNVAKAYDNLIFLSGQIGANPSNPTTGKLEGDITQQTAQAISNLKAVLAASNSTLDQVIKCTVFLTDMNNFNLFNAEYGKYFKAGKEPARSTVAVKALPREALVQIEAVAAVTE